MATFGSPAISTSSLSAPSALSNLAEVVAEAERLEVERPDSPVPLVISQPTQSPPGNPTPRAVMSAHATQVPAPAAAASTSVQTTASAQAAPTLEATAADLAEIAQRTREALGNASTSASPSTASAVDAGAGRQTRRRLQMPEGSLVVAPSGAPTSAPITLTATATTTAAALGAPTAAVTAPKGPKDVSGGPKAKDK